MFTAPAWLVSKFFDLTHSYGLSIALVALTVMILVTPLTLKSTKGMLEMQRLQPEMKRLQAQYRGDRQKLNEEMMKLYQEHKVNPLASCLPLVIQMPVFFIMYRVLRGLSRTYTCVPDGNGKMADICNTLIKAGHNVAGKQVFDPAHISKASALYKSLAGKNEMLSFGLDLSKSPAHFISQSVGKGLIYAALVVVLGLLYFAQQKMVASRAAVNPTMSATQAKLMQYLPVIFAVFQIFFLTGLVIYYITQALFRIAQNFYITKKFYGHEHSLGRQAQAAGIKAREEAKINGTDKEPASGGMFAQAKRDAQARRDAQLEKTGRPAGATSRTASARPAGNKSNGSRPAPSQARSGKPAPTSKPAPVAKPMPAAKAPASPKVDRAPASTPEVSSSKPSTPPKNRPTPSAARPQRPTANARPGAPARPKPPKQ
ncbi:MAG: OxaA family protein [Ilumatobacteraceae bacterium]|nr:OxaA family protein [Ilumatobacteraceae bacterium]